MKAIARVEIIKSLSRHDLGIDLESLTDTELRQLNRKCVNYINDCKYAVSLKGNFEKDLPNGNLIFHSFRNTPGIRHMTPAEFLQFESFVNNNPKTYPFYKVRRDVYEY